jgi:hypothetical protein
MNAMSNATFLEGSLTDNLDSVVDFTNIMETKVNSIHFQYTLLNLVILVTFVV